MLKKMVPVEIEFCDILISGLGVEWDMLRVCLSFSCIEFGQS